MIWKLSKQLNTELCYVACVHFFVMVISIFTIEPTNFKKSYSRISEKHQTSINLTLFSILTDIINLCRKIRIFQQSHHYGGQANVNKQSDFQERQKETIIFLLLDDKFKQRHKEKIYNITGYDLYEIKKELSGDIG